MRRTAFILLVVLVGLSTAPFGTGCNDPVYQEGLDRRIGSLRRNIELIAERENSSPDRMRFTAQAIERIENWRYEYRQSELIGRLATHDFAHFAENKVRNRENLLRMFEGDPDRIRWTAPRIAP